MSICYLILCIVFYLTLKPGFSWGQSSEERGRGTISDVGLWGCATQQGLAFGIRTLEVGILFGLELYDWVKFLPRNSGNKCESRFSI